MAVQIQKVKDLLDNPAATSVPNDTISANINRSQAIVDTVKDPDATTTNVDHAVTALAVWLTYGSYMEGITQQLGAISQADQVKLDHLRGVAELYVNQISRSKFDLDPDAEDELVGTDPSAFKLTTSEAYKFETT